MFDRIEINAKGFPKSKFHQSTIAEIVQRNQSMKKLYCETQKENATQNELFRFIQQGIPCFQESYVIKKGILVTTGIEVFISARDAQFIKDAPREVLEKEIEKLAQNIGHPEFKRQINNVIQWIAVNCYEKEKDNDGNLEVYMDLLKLVRGKHEIKVGKNWYSFPEDILRGKSKKKFDY